MTTPISASRPVLQQWLRTNFRFTALLLLFSVCFFRLGAVQRSATDREGSAPTEEPFTMPFMLEMSVSRFVVD